MGRPNERGKTMSWYSDYLTGVSQDFAAIHQIYHAEMGAGDDFPHIAAAAMQQAANFKNENDVFTSVENYATAVLTNSVPIYPARETFEPEAFICALAGCMIHYLRVAGAYDYDAQTHVRQLRYAIADYAARVGADPAIALKHLPRED